MKFFGSGWRRRRLASFGGLEETFYIRDVVGAAVGGEAVEEGGAVAGGADAGVEEH